MIRLGLIFFSLMVFGPFAFAAEWLAVEGRLVESDGITSIEASSVIFTLEIHPPGGDCVLYSEVHSPIDMSGSNGFFSLKLGNGGSPSGVASNFLDAFNNSSSTDFTSCPFTPTAASSRDLKISYNAGSGLQALSVPISIGASAFAHDAHRLNGKSESDFLQVNSAGAQLTQAALESVFLNAAYVAELQSLAAGTSTEYVSATPAASVGFNNQRVTDVGTPTGANDAANKNYVDANLGGNTINTGVLGAGETGEVLTWNGTQWVAQTLSAAGDVNNGGNTFAGLMTLGTNDNFGLALETNNTVALTIDNTQGVSMTAGLGVTGGINAGGNLALLAESELRLEDAAGGEYIGFKAPTAVTASQTFTLPDGDGTANQVLETDGSGTLAWVNNGGVTFHSGLSGLGADDHTQYSLLAGRSSGQSLFGGTDANDDMTIDSTSNATKGNVLLNPIGGNVGVGTSIPATKLDVEGRITTGPIDGTAGNTGSIIFEDSDASNTSGIRAADVTTADYILTLPATAGASNQILSNTATPGVLAWTTPTTGTGDFLAAGTVAMTGNLNLDNNFIIGGTASGDDVTIESTTNATKGDVLINPTGGNVGIGFGAPGDKLEVEGDIRIRSGKQLRIAESDNSNVVTFAAPSLASDVNFILPSDDGDNDQVLKTDGSGVLSWTAVTIAGNSVTSASIVDTSILGVDMDFVGTPDFSDGFVDGGDTLLLYNDSNTVVEEVTVSDLTDGLLTHDGSVPMSGDLDLGSNRIQNLFAGAAGNPSLSFDGNTNTGLFQPATNTFAFTTNGLERARFTNTGELGIGTTIPATMLEVQGRITSGPINGLGGNTGSIVMRELGSNGFDTVGLRAPDMLATDLMWTLPSTLGTANQVLRHSASPGELEWATSGDFLADGGVAMTGNFRLGNNFLSNDGDTEGVFVDTDGNVGIGTNTPAAALDVNGAIKSSNAINNASATINFALGNIQYTDNNCGGFIFHNLKDGGSYTFNVRGTAITTCSFTAFSDAGSSALIVHMPPGHGATTASTHTLYEMKVIEARVYVKWTPGY